MTIEYPSDPRHTKSIPHTHHAKMKRVANESRYRSKRMRKKNSYLLEQQIASGCIDLPELRDWIQESCPLDSHIADALREIPDLQIKVHSGHFNREQVLFKLCKSKGLFAFRNRVHGNWQDHSIDEWLVRFVQEHYLEIHTDGGGMTVDMIGKLVNRTLAKPHVLSWACKQVPEGDKGEFVLAPGSKLFPGGVLLNRRSMGPVVAAFAEHGEESIQFLDAVADFADRLPDAMYLQDECQDESLVIWACWKCILPIGMPQDFVGLDVSSFLDDDELVL